MYSFSDIRKAIKNPALIKREPNRLYHTRARRLPYNTNGINVFDEDWDTLILLDACRYDIFEQTVILDGRLESRISRGSTSPEWVAGNFKDKQLHDTVYVSANIWYARLEEDLNSDVHDFIGTNSDEVPGELNPAARQLAGRGMHPQTITRIAIEAMEQYPNKRFIIHYMQPHQPYIGSQGNRHFEAEGNTISRFAAGERPASINTLREAYAENLEVALEYIPEVLECRDDRTVISADHGEMLGDRYSPIPFRDFGHPEGIYCEQLVKVPWFIIEDESRPNIVSEKPTSRHYQPQEEQVEERLRKLGYLD